MILGHLAFQFGRGIPFYIFIPSEQAPAKQGDRPFESEIPGIERQLQESYIYTAGTLIFGWLSSKRVPMSGGGPAGLLRRSRRRRCQVYSMELSQCGQGGDPGVVAFRHSGIKEVSYMEVEVALCTATMLHDMGSSANCHAWYVR